MFLFFSTLDSAINRQFGFQDPATPIMEGIIDLHHHIFFFLIIIFFFVLWMSIFIFNKFTASFSDLYVWSRPRKSPIFFYGSYFFSKGLIFKGNRMPLGYMNILRRYARTMYVVHGTTLELVWTIVPTFILLAIAVPSFSLLYSIDEVIDPILTVKIMGHQWYWSYELADLSLRKFLMSADFNGIEFDSYMIPEDELDLGDLRLLEVDNFLLLPTRIHIRLLITSSDVIHAWAVPSLGVKVDAVPGRLNQASVFIKRPGFFYGQCSELCGVNHGFMPICVIASDNINDFSQWLMLFAE